MTTLESLPTQITFKSVNDFQAYCARVARGLGIYSRTGRAKADAKLVVWSDYDTARMVDATGLYLKKYFAPKLRVSLYAVERAVKTGRLHASAQAMVDSLSGYQFAQMVIKFAIVGMTMDEITDYLNGKGSITLPTLPKAS